jgi:hypothetical protein
MRKWSLKGEDEMFRWGQLQQKVQVAKAEDDQAEEDLGEIPDDFLGKLALKSISCGNSLIFIRSSHVYPYGRPSHPSQLADIYRPFYYSLALAQ